MQELLNWQFAFQAPGLCWILIQLPHGASCAATALLKMGRTHDGLHSPDDRLQRGGCNVGTKLALELPHATDHAAFAMHALLPV